MNPNGSTFTIIEASQSENLFGDYADASWDSNSGFKSDTNAFVFSRIYKNKPKM